MPEHSPAQKQYLLRVRRKKYMIHVSRILLFLGFLFYGKCLPDGDGLILLSSAVRLKSGRHFLQ